MTHDDIDIDTDTGVPFEIIETYMRVTFGFDVYPLEAPSGLPLARQARQGVVASRSATAASD